MTSTVSHANFSAVTSRSTMPCRSTGITAAPTRGTDNDGRTRDYNMAPTRLLAHLKITDKFDPPASTCHSTAECSILALAHTLRKLLPIRRLLQLATNNESSRTSMFCDNQTALKILKRPLSYFLTSPHTHCYQHNSSCRRLSRYHHQIRFLRRQSRKHSHIQRICGFLLASHALSSQAARFHLFSVPLWRGSADPCLTLAP